MSPFPRSKEASTTANLRVIGVKELHSTDEGADDASKAHRPQHLPGQALRLAALLAASRLGSTCGQQRACQLHKGLHLRAAPETEHVKHPQGGNPAHITSESAAAKCSRHCCRCQQNPHNKLC